MIYIPIELRLAWIQEDLAFIKNHITNHYPMRSWPCCPDCGDETCFQYSKCMKLCGVCESVRSLGLGETCSAHAPEFRAAMVLPL